MLTFIHKHWTNDIEQPVPSQDGGGQAPGVVDLVHVDTECKHYVIRLDINEVISSTVVTRLRTGRRTPENLTQYFSYILAKKRQWIHNTHKKSWVPVPRGVLTKYPGVHLQRPDEHESIVGSLNHDAGQAGADRLDDGLRVHADLVPH